MYRASPPKACFTLQTALLSFAEGIPFSTMRDSFSVSWEPPPQHNIPIALQKHRRDELYLIPPTYNAPQVDRIWLRVHYNKIPKCPIFYPGTISLDSLRLKLT